MKLSIVLSVVLLSLSSVMPIHGAPTTHQHNKSGKKQGALSETLLSSSSSSSSPSSSSAAAKSTPKTSKLSASAESQLGNGPEDLNSRRAKMINYFGYYPGFYGPSAPLSPQAAFMTPYSQMNDFYQFPYGTIAPVYSYNGLLGPEADDSYESEETQSTATGNDVDSNELEYDEDMFSRANRRRHPGKGNSNRNSPIFYIRLPPTPYMFIQGLGYISNPPTIQPLPTPMPVHPSFNFNQNPYQNPYMPMPAANPFINLPVNYMSNAKPVGVYQYPGGGYQQPPVPPRFPLGNYGPNQVTPIRHRPSAVGQNTNGNGYSNPDSKITHLKGPFIFNGRPEDIYLLQNLQTTPYNANFYHGYY